MRLRTIIFLSAVIVGLILLAGACSAGFVAGQFYPQANSSSLAYSPLSPIIEKLGFEPASEGATATPGKLGELFQPFWQTWDLVKAEYVDQPVDDELLMRGAIRGLLQSLEDPHTSYLDPEMFEQANAHLDGEAYEGIGAWVDTTGEYLTIISAMPGSPAEKAGLKPNDRVIAIDGDDMTGIDGELVRQRVIGPKDSIVILSIRREGLEEPFDVEIKRASIVVPTIEGKMLEENIAYVQLYTFGDDTHRDLESELKDLLDQNPAGLILDLRFNGGGYLNTAIEVVSQFISDGIVMVEEYGDGRKDNYEAKRGGIATEIPIVVLINEGSASASEIVAGAIQDRERGILVGTTSFGKGSVQTYSELKNDQGAVRVTIARWLTPKGRQIMGIGLEPDIMVEISDEDYESGSDPQLEEAVEWLLKQVSGQ